MPTITIPDFGKGVNLDLMPSELGSGVWSDCQNYRFRHGFAEKFDGVPNAGNKFTALGNPMWIQPYATPSTYWTFYYAYNTSANEGSAYAESTATTATLTRYTAGVKITSITFVGATATVTTDSAHGRTTGDAITVYLAFPAEYNGVFAITVTSATTFTYTMSGTPATNADPVGAYSYNVESKFTGSATAIIGRLNRVTGGVLNGALIFNHPIDGLYYWNGDASTRLRLLPNSYVADTGRPFKNFIVQLAPTIGGVKYPHDVLWSKSAEPGSVPVEFDSASDNDAGRFPLAETPGQMVDSLPLGDVNIIYKQDARYAMQYIGGNEVFKFTRLPGEDGLLYRQCVVDTPKGHVFLSQNLDVRIHQGGESRSLAEGRVKRFITDNTPSGGNAYAGCWLASYPEKQEVWVAIPNVSAIGCALILVWNWESDTWGKFVIPGTRYPTNAASGMYKPNSAGDSPQSYLALGIPGNGTYNVAFLDGETFSNTFFGETITAFLERRGLHFDDRTITKAIQRSRWNLDDTQRSSSPTREATVQHGASMYADTAPTYTSGTTCTYGVTDWTDARATNGRFCAIKFTTSAGLGVRSVDLDVTKGGKR